MYVKGLRSLSFQDAAEDMVELWDNALLRAVENYNSAEGTANPGEVSTQDSATETQEDVAKTQQDVSNSQDGAAESQQETLETEPSAEPSKHKNIPDNARSKGRDLSDYLDDEGDVMFEEREYNFKKEYERSVLGSFSIEKLNDSIHVTKRVLATLEKEKFFTGESRKRIETNLESGMQIEINKSSIDETFSGSNYGRLGRFVKIAKLTTVRMLPEIIQRGTLISDYHSNAINKKFAYFEYPVTIEGIPLNIKLSVKKSPQKNKLWVHSIYVQKSTDGFGGISSNEIKPPYRTIGTGEIISQDHTGVKKKPKSDFN